MQVDKLRSVIIGHQHDDGATLIKFDLSPWQARWPDVVCHIDAMRPNETTAYQPFTTQQDSYLYWLVTSYDTALIGGPHHSDGGRAQIVGQANGKTVVSEQFNTSILESIDDNSGGEIPEPVQTWLEYILGELAKIGNLDNLDTTAHNNLVAAINEVYEGLRPRGYYDEIEKLEDYAYVVYYSDLDYTLLNVSSGDTALGGCSAVRVGNFYGRNFDWTYNDFPEFVIHTQHANGRNETWGTVGQIIGLDRETVEAGTKSPLYCVAPFRIVDGINEHGLAMNSNVVPLDKGPNDGIPTEASLIDVSVRSLVRYVLDNFATAEEAIDHLQKYVTIHQSSYMTSLGFELHWLIADASSTYVLELIDGHLVATTADQMTNFHVSGTIFNEDGTVYTPYTSDETHNAELTNNITPHAAGLERWNALVAGKQSATSLAAMRMLMSQIKYTNAYQPANNWCTEFTGISSLTAGSPYEDFLPALTVAHQMYLNRSRETADTWQTTHSIVFDLAAKAMHIIFQEGTTEYEFACDAILEKIGNLANLETEAKQNLVAAINELAAEISVLSQQIADLNI